MNYQRGTVLVVSKDGITFAVETDRISAAFEQAYAKHRTAAELDLNSDFTRTRDVEVKALLAPPAPRARPTLTLIKGGKYGSA